MNTSAEKRIVIGFASIVLILFFLVVYFYKNSRQYQEASHWITHTNVVLYNLEKSMSAISEIEASQRGYCISENPLFLDQYTARQTELKQHLKNIKLLTADNPFHHKRLDSLTLLINRKLQYSNTLLELSQRQGFNAVKKKMLSLEGKYLMDNIREMLQKMEDEENRLLLARMEVQDNKIFYFNLTLFGLILFVTSLIVVTFYLFYIQFQLRKENEKKLQKDWTLFQSILDNTDVGIFIKDLNGLYLLANKEFELGIAKGVSIINKTNEEILPPDIAAKLTAHDKRVLSTQQLIREEETIVTPNGILTILMVLFPLLENGKMVAICGIFTDISERKRHEDKLIYHSHLLDNASEAIIAGDADWKITVWNKSAERMFGYTSKETIGQPYHEFLISDNTPEQRAEVFRVLEMQRYFEGEALFYKKNKEKFSALYSVSFFYEADNDRMDKIIVIKDITERQKQDDEIRHLNRELEAYTYSVSHDLRAPLRSIYGYTKILTEEYAPLLGNEAKRLTGVILKNSLRMSALIDDLLTFSRLGKRDVVRLHMNNVDTVESILNELQTTPERRNVQVRIGHLPAVFADISMMRQVWFNLLDNAMKYSSGNSHPEIDIDSYTEKNTIVFSVKDNGVGFDMQYAGKLFGVFQRLHGSDEFEGTGVGLALAQRIIRKHGGNIWATAEIDKGAVFYFSLPNEVNPSEQVLL